MYNLRIDIVLLKCRVGDGGVGDVRLMPVATTKELLVHTTNATERVMVSKSCLKLGGMKYHLHELQKLYVYGRTERLVEQHTKLRPAMYVGSLTAG